MKTALVLALAITLSAMTPSIGSAEHEISNKDFYFIIPESMTQTRPSTPEVPVLLGSSNGYPTFNIVVSSTRYDPRTVDIQQHARRTLEEYRKIGLTDASIADTEQITIGDSTLPLIIIRYSLNGVKYQAAVTYVPATTKHFVLTYIDFQETYARNSAVLDTIYASFKVAESQRLPPLGEDDKSEAEYTVLISLAALVAGAVLYLTARRLKSSGSAPEKR